jgi:protease-4
LAANSSQSEVDKPNLIKIELKGPIVSASDFLKQVEEAQKPNYKGVLVEVDSPGGAVAPSIEISMSLKRLKNQKPVIVYASGIIASGSYYASIHADKIIANPGSIVGSIGVIFQGLNAKELLDKIGIKPQYVNAGKYKQVGTPTREWSKLEREELEKVIKDTYNLFVSDVANARGLDINKSSIFADAHIFLASKAVEVGLIDSVGSIEDAKNELILKSGVQKAKWKKKDELEMLLEKVANSSVNLIFERLYGMRAF